MMRNDRVQHLMAEPSQLARWESFRSAASTGNDEQVDAVRDACEQGLAGLVLAHHSMGDFPAGELRTLQSGAARVGAENLHALNELARVAGVFHGQKIPLLLLKGAALNLCVYPRLDLRPMSDLDLLVAPQDAGRALQLLKSIGYVDGAPLLRDDFFPALYYEREMLLPGARPVRIDLHAHPLRPLHLAPVIAPESFWADAEPVSLRDSLVLVPCPETMLVHLAAHAAFHGCSRLIWLLDLKYVVEHHAGRMDWGRVLQCAMEWQLCWAMRRALEAARETVGLECPREFLECLERVRPSWRDRLTIWHTPRDASSPLIHVGCNLACLRGLRTRAVYLAALLLPGPCHLAGLYPLRHPGWTWCAHAVRTARSVFRTLAMPVRALRRFFPSLHRGDVAC